MSEQSITPTVIPPEHGISADETIAETIVDGRSPRPSTKPGRLTRGAMVGRYIVLDMLGRGGMGIVYAAYDPDLDRKVALKLILPGRDDGVAARLRLQREAQAIAQLAHPNVVAVHDVGAVDDKVFIAMEFVEGMDLARWLVAEPRSRAEVLELFHQAGTGLAAAHSAGLVHRDFKPENVLVGTDGRARVVDFGLVRRDDHSMSQSSIRSSAELMEVSQRHGRSAPDLQLTDAGAMVGTPAYMSPEQFSGLSGDPRADQFSFCVSLYEGLYGERPFEGDNPADLSYSVTQGIVRAPPAKHDVSGRLRRVLLRGLSIDPDDRYPGMEALLAALRKANAPRRRLWVLPLVLGGVGAAVFALREPAATDDPCLATGEPASALWGPSRQQTILQAFRDTGRPYADGTWDRMAPRVDRYLEEWTEIRQAVCRDHGGLEAAALADDPRLQCLDQRMSEVSDLLLELEHADARLMTDAVKLVSRLSTVERCSEFSTLEEFPEPTEPELREMVHQLRSDFRRWQMHSSRREESEAEFADIVRRVEALGYGPLQAEMLDHQASKAIVAGKLDEAVELGNRAFEAALASRHDFMAFQAATGLVFLHGVQRREPTDAYRWARRGEALLERFGADAKPRIQLLNAEASVYSLAGKGEQARALYEEALGLVRQLDDRILLATLLNNIGAFHAEQRRLTLASTYLEEAASINREVLGPSHPAVLRTQANLGIIAVFDNRTEDGMKILEVVLPEQESVLGPFHPDIANTLESISTVHMRRGEFEKATEVGRRLLEIRERSHGPRSRPVLSAKLNIASALIFAEELDEAYTLLQQIRADVESSEEPDPRIHIDTLVDLAGVAIQLDEARPDREGFHTEAHGLGTTLLKRCRGDNGCSALNLPRTLVAVANTRLHTGDAAGARELYAEALEAPEPEDQPWLHGRARLGLARATLEVDLDVALAHARRARRDLQRDDRTSKNVLEDVEAWLAEHEPERGGSDAD